MARFRVANLRRLPGDPSYSTAPAITGQRVVRISDTSVVVEWSVSPASTGQVSYGTTASYGSQTTLVSSYLGFHSIQISGLTPGTLYHFAITSVNQYGQSTTTDDSVFTTTSTTAGVYGPAFNQDSKNNLALTAAPASLKYAFRWRATQSLPITSVTWSLRTGTGGYSAGTGGDIRVSIQADSAGSPSGTPLASVTHTSAASGYTTSTGHYKKSTFSSPYTVTAGTLYHVVFENLHATPASNYVSVNQCYMFNAVTPRQPFDSSGDMATLKFNGSWNVQNNDFPTFEISYNNDAAYDGQAYLEAMLAQNRVISGTTSMVRERFTVSGGSKTVTEAWVRVGRQSGSGNITIRLEDDAGNLIEEKTASVAGVNLWTRGADADNGDWVGIQFTTPRTLTNGNAYRLRISSDVGTSCSMVPIRSYDSSGTTTADPGMDSRYFSDGVAQYTTNSGGTWTAFYTDSSGRSVNMQFFFVTS